MPYQPTTNFRDSNGVDLGKKLVTKDYLLSVYGSILDSVPDTGLTATPALWTWGRNSYGQLGVNSTINRSTPVTTFSAGTNWKQVSAGGVSSAAIKTDGTLWTWGRANLATLGNNNTTNRSTPITTFAGGNNWSQVKCANGGSFVIAIKTDGTLWGWGFNNRGQLGINDSGTDRFTPVTTILGGNNWKFISPGGLHTTAIKTDGTLWTWGGNINGGLGINNAIDRSTPVTTILGGNNWKTVCGGGGHTTAIKTDGTLWAWGFNFTGQVGNNSGTQVNTPVTTFAGGNNWKSIANGYRHSLAIKTDGTLWTWGYNAFGQLGVNDSINRSTPVTTLLGGTNWKSVYGSTDNSAAIKTDGSLWVWGRNNDFGQIGINNIINRSTPVTTFLGGNNWKDASVGAGFLMAIQSVSDI